MGKENDNDNVNDNEVEMVTYQDDDEKIEDQLNQSIDNALSTPVKEQGDDAFGKLNDETESQEIQSAPTPNTKGGLDLSTIPSIKSQSKELLLDSS